MNRKNCDHPKIREDVPNDHIFILDDMNKKFYHGDMVCYCNKCKHIFELHFFRDEQGRFDGDVGEDKYSQGMERKLKRAYKDEIAKIESVQSVW